MSAMRVLIVAMAACAALTVSAAETPLSKLLEAELARFPAKAGVYVKHLPSGEEAAVRGDEPFNSASVIKLPIMGLAYELADQKKIDLSKRLEFARRDIRGGSGVFRYHDAGLNPTVRDVVMQMIITSDNSATDMAIGQVGGVDAVNLWISARGFTGMKLQYTIFEVFRRRYELLDPTLASLTPEDLYALQTSNPALATSPATVERALAELRKRPLQREWNRQVNEDQRTWLGVMTPRGTGRLLEAIENGTIASRESAAEMKRVLRQQQSGARRMPHYVDVPVGHKTGDFPPNVANDVGIVYARTGPIVVAFFTMQIREPYGELEDRIGRVTRTIVDYFDGKTGGP